MQTKVEFGIHVLTHAMYNFDIVSQIAVSAEDLGYNYCFVGDHFFSEEKAYKGLNWDPKKPTKLDPWTTLSALAVKKSKIRLGTCVSPIPFYQPSRLAKMVACLDVISSGRIVLGVGVGRSKEEALAYGIRWDDFRTRIEKMREGLQIILKMWIEDRATFRGKHYSVSDAPLYPKPIQKPHPPIWFGGAAKPILEDAARLGNGWAIGSYGKWAQIPLFDLFDKCVRKITELAERFNRIPSSIKFAPIIVFSTKRSAANWIREIGKFVDSGANCILIKPYLPSQETIRQIRFFAKNVIPSF